MGKVRRTQRWACVCGRPLAEMRLDFPEGEIVAYQLTVYPGLICPACRLAITDARMVKPKNPDLEPKNPYQLVLNRPQLEAIVRSLRVAEECVAVHLSLSPGLTKQ